MYKQGLALNNVQWLICYKTQSNQITIRWGLVSYPGHSFWREGVLPLCKSTHPVYSKSQQQVDEGGGLIEKDKNFMLNINAHKRCS